MKLVPKPISKLNTEFSEYLPSLTADAKIMVFTRRTKFNDEDLYISYFENNEWTPAEPIDELNSPNNEGSPAISPDGLSLVFTSCDRINSYGGCDLYISYFKSDHWTEPINMGEKLIQRLTNHRLALVRTDPVFFYQQQKRHLGWI